MKYQQLRSSSKGKMGKSAMKILGMKDEEFYEVGLNLSNLCNWYFVPLMEDSLGCLDDDTLRGWGSTL